MKPMAGADQPLDTSVKEPMTYPVRESGDDRKSNGTNEYEIVSLRARALAMGPEHRGTPVT